MSAVCTLRNLYQRVSGSLLPNVRRAKSRKAGCNEDEDLPWSGEEELLVKSTVVARWFTRTATGREYGWRSTAQAMAGFGVNDFAFSILRDDDDDDDDDDGDDDDDDDDDDGDDGDDGDGDGDGDE